MWPRPVPGRGCLFQSRDRVFPIPYYTAALVLTAASLANSAARRRRVALRFKRAAKSTSRRRHPRARRGGAAVFPICHACDRSAGHRGRRRQRKPFANAVFRRAALPSHKKSAKCAVLYSAQSGTKRMITPSSRPRRWLRTANVGARVRCHEQRASLPLLRGGLPVCGRDLRH
jgi:hypothetical protein